MKKRYIFFLTVLILILGACFTAGSFLKIQAENFLQAKMPGSTVRIMDSRINFLASIIHFSEIDIEQPGSVQLRIQQADIDYSWWHLLNREIDQITLKNPRLIIETPQRNFTFTAPAAQPSAQLPWKLNNFQIDELDLTVKAKNLKLNGIFSMSLNIEQGQFNTLSITIPDVQTPNWSAKNIALAAIHSMNTGEMSIDSLMVNKLKIVDIKSSVRLDDQHKLFCDGLSGKILNGFFTGKVSIEMTRFADYRITLDLTNLDTARLVTELELNKKFTLTGLLKGHLEILARGTQLRSLTGNFDFGVAGGTLQIYDTSFLDHLAKLYQQNLDLVKDTFKNYEYSTGTVNMTLDDQKAIVIAVHLDGKTGKRDFNVYLHDYLKKDDL